MRTALVLGGAGCLWDDIAAAQEIGSYDAVCACNDAGAAWSGPLHIWATLHPELMAGWSEKRELRGYSPADIYAYHRPAQPGEPRAAIVSPYHYRRTDKSPSSGLFAAKVVVEADFDRIVLCGVPLAPAEAHFFDGSIWKVGNTFMKGFAQMAPYLRDNVRSMSGHTREVLGAPTADWLAGRE